MVRRHGAPALISVRVERKCDARRRCGIPGQGQDNQQVSGIRLHGSGLLRPCARPASQGWFGRYRTGLRHDLGSGRRQPQARESNRRCAGQGQRPDSGDRPRPRGRGDQLAPGRNPAPAQGDQERHPRQPGRVQRHHQGRRDRGDAAPPPGRCPAGRGLPGAPRAGLPCGVQTFAGALAQAAGGTQRRPGAIGLPAPDRRARDGDRGVSRPRILVRHRPPGHTARSGVRGATDPAGRQEAGPLRSGKRDPGRNGRAGRHLARPVGDLGRGETRLAQPLGPFHDLDPAAGGQPQIRHGRAPMHERGAAPLRGGAHHLHADRRHRHGARGRDGHARCDQGPLRRRICARQPAHVQEQGQERAGSA